MNPTQKKVDKKLVLKKETVQALKAGTPLAHPPITVRITCPTL